MRISPEAIYQALYMQGRGALKRELTACLREVLISERPVEADGRAVAQAPPIGRFASPRKPGFLRPGFLFFGGGKSWEARGGCRRLAGRCGHARRNRQHCRQHARPASPGWRIKRCICSIIYVR
jgi:hypothetical protein